MFRWNLTRVKLQAGGNQYGPMFLPVKLSVLTAAHLSQQNYGTQPTNTEGLFTSATACTATGKKFCRTGHFSEDELKTLAVKAINQYLDNKDEVIGNLTMLRGTLYTTEELTRTYDRLYAEAEAAKELFYNSSSKGPLTDPAGLEFLQKRYDEAYRQLAETEKEIKRREDGKKNFDMVIDQLRNSEDQIQDYSLALFNSLVEKMTVYSKSRVVCSYLQMRY